MTASINPVLRLWNLLREEKTDVYAIYFYALLNGLIQLSIPVGIQAIIGFVLGGTMSASLVVLIATLILAVLFAGLMQVNQMKIVEKIQQRIFVRYAFAFADTIPRLDLKMVDGYYLPELVNRFFDVVLLQKSISKILLDLPTATMQILLGLILLSFYHPFFILFGLLLVFLLWLMLFATGSSGLESSVEESTEKYAVAGWFEELARLIKSFKFAIAYGLHLQKADAKTIAYLQSRTRHFKVLLVQYKGLVVFKVAITAAMLVGGVVLLLNQKINMGQFVAAEIIILTIINSVEKIIINLDSVYDVLTAVTKIGMLTDKPVEASGTYLFDQGFAPSVSGQQLSFSYNREKQVLSYISFNVLAGQKVCITGNSGSGKSTLLKLISGVYNDFEGNLLINEIPIGNYDLSMLRQSMGILFQQENIFHGTLWQNITMGRDNVQLSYVHHLCAATGFNQFLATLPLGFDTYLDPTGKRLPRNVVQKILLIRAMAHQPKMLLLEEPWHGIAPDEALRIKHLLLHLPQTTVIITTHDETFAAQCQQVIHLT